MEYTLTVNYQKIDTLNDLSSVDRELVEAARIAAQSAHAPYSQFRVGAAARLDSGEIITGVNFESEVFPAGLCAERALLFSVTHRQTCKIESFAVVSLSTPSECYPCGVCRQTLLDVERRQGSSIRVIMAGESSATIVESAAALLPFAFKL